MPVDPAVFDRFTDDDTDPEPHPKPEVSEREPEAGELPRAAVQFIKVADECGWSHRDRYSRGWWGPEAKDASDFVSVSVSPPGRRTRAFVLWRDGKAFETWEHVGHWKRSKVNDVKKMMRGSD